MTTLEHRISVIINRDHPLDSDDIRLKLKDSSVPMERSKRRIRQVLKTMAEAGELKRIWREQTDELPGRWLYNLPEYAEPMKRLPGLPSMETIMGHISKHAYCMANRVRGIK